METRFTHKGWFGVCPVYFANLNTDCPVVHPRSLWFMPLMHVSEVMFVAEVVLGSFIWPGIEPRWELKITGELQSAARAGSAAISG